MSSRETSHWPESDWATCTYFFSARRITRKNCPSTNFCVDPVCVYVLCLRVSVCVSNVCVGIAAEPCIWSLCPLFGSGTPLLYQVGISGAFSHAAARHLPLRGSQHPASHRNRCSSCLILSSSLARRQDWQLVLLRCHGRRAMLFGSRLHLRHRYDFECPPVGAS